MHTRLLELTKKLWHDPVWSKVIAAGILAVGGGLFGLLFWAGQHEESKSREKSFTDEELNYRNFGMGNCEKPQDVAKLYAIARELTSKEQQDAEFSGLVLGALCINDERLALEVFTAIADPTFKDVASKRAIDKYMRDKRYEDASRWVKQLTNAQDRNWWTRRILESKRRDG